VEGDDDWVDVDTDDDLPENLKLFFIHKKEGDCKFV